MTAASETPPPGGPGAHAANANPSATNPMGGNDPGADDLARMFEMVATPREKELEAEVAKMKDQALRALAEAENIRRRAEREKEDTAKYAVSKLAKELLSVADNLRRALDAVPPEKRDDTVKTMVSGVELTERELLAAFERAGIRRIDPMGEKFDYNLHQAMFEVETPDKPAGTVVQVMQPGYVIHDRLLRPALVGVSKAPAGSPPTERVNTVA
jgi:molecular chaperone GrpE